MTTGSPNRQRPRRLGVQAKPPLTVNQILEWADAHFERTGRWPRKKSGPLFGVVDTTWYGIHRALLEGFRGLPGGVSLPMFLHQRRGVRHRLTLPPYTIKRILGWADAHQRRTGKWPRQKSGPIPDAPGETWLKIGRALREGRRGLAGGSSLAWLLKEHRGFTQQSTRTPLTIRQIVALY